MLCLIKLHRKKLTSGRILLPVLQTFLKKYLAGQQKVNQPFIVINAAGYGDHAIFSVANNTCQASATFFSSKSLAAYRCTSFSISAGLIEKYWTIFLKCSSSKAGSTRGISCIFPNCPR